MDDYEFDKSLDKYQEQIYFRRINRWQEIEDTIEMIEDFKNEAAEHERLAKLKTKIAETMKTNLEILKLEFHQEFGE